jgi:hypothetical protein
MGTRAPSQTQRDENLDNLVAAMERLGEVEANRLENEVRFLRQVLQGRGAQEAISANLDVAAELTQADINQFVEISGT